MNYIFDIRLRVIKNIYPPLKKISLMKNQTLYSTILGVAVITTISLNIYCYKITNSTNGKEMSPADYNKQTERSYVTTY